jgi:hypothetical protein
LKVNDFSQLLASVNFLFLNMGRKVNGKFNVECRVVVHGSILSRRVKIKNEIMSGLKLEICHHNVKWILIVGVSQERII